MRNDILYFLLLQFTSSFSLQKKRLQCGVTLIELLVAISIMAILMLIGAPSFQSMIVSNRLTSEANALVSTLSLARTEAIKRNRQVAVVAETAGVWNDGWKIVVDSDGDGVFDNDEIQHYGAINRSIKIINRGFINRVAYRPDGRSSNNGHFDICSLSSDTDYREVIIFTGRVRVATQNSVADELTHTSHDEACP